MAAARCRALELEPNASTLTSFTGLAAPSGPSGSAATPSLSPRASRSRGRLLALQLTQSSCSSLSKFSSWPWSSKKVMLLWALAFSSQRSQSWIDSVFCLDRVSPAPARARLGRAPRLLADHSNSAKVTGSPTRAPDVAVCCKALNVAGARSITVVLKQAIWGKIAMGCPTTSPLLSSTRSQSEVSVSRRLASGNGTASVS